MNLQLIQGQFSSMDAVDLITQMVNVKIKFHESKINNAHNEEDIKMREQRIKQLQLHLHECRSHIENQGGMITITSELSFN